MPFTTDELSTAGKACLDFYIKNNPIDQIGTERPLLAKMTAGKKSFPGAKEYVIEQLRTDYGSNFQWFSGDQQVSYNKRDTLDQTKFPWRSAHDGFTLNEDQLLQNGITLTDGAPGQNSAAERLQLTNILNENNEVLRLGFEQKFDLELHRDGTQGTDALAGIDLLIATDPTTGTVGGIDRSTNEWWRNNKSTGISTSTAGTLVDEMEKMWRACRRNGGAPNLILMGSDFLDAFRKDTASQVSRYLANGNNASMDPSISNLAFQKVPVTWDPVFADLDDADSPTIHWEKRCYFINTNFIRLRPAEGHDMVTRKPPRVYDRYAHYWGLTWKGALTMSRANAHAVLSIS